MNDIDDTAVVVTIVMILQKPMMVIGDDNVAEP